MTRVPIRIEPRLKYKNRHTYVDNIRFDSAAEAGWYQKLKLLEKIGQIKNFVWDKSKLRFRLEIKGILITVYVADFSFVEIAANGVETPVVLDVKGKRTKDYIIKKRLMQALHGIVIREVK